LELQRTTRLVVVVLLIKMGGGNKPWKKIKPRPPWQNQI